MMCRNLRVAITVFDFFILQSMKTIARAQSPDIRQIDLDVNRTYRDHIMFRERYGVK